MKAILTVGASSSGKSTWAKDFVKQNPSYHEVNRDEIRRELFQFGGWHEYKFTKGKENQATTLQLARIQSCALNGKNLILSDTFLNQKTRANTINTLESLGYEVELKVFHVPYAELVKRSSERQWAVPPTVLYQQWLQMERYIGVEPHVFSSDKIDCVVCDLDGTLAHMNGKRGPFEWHNVGRDDVDLDVKALLDANYYGTGKDYRRKQIILLSGRDSCCRNETELWLKAKEVKYNQLFMRAEGDQRPDYIVKKELYDTHVKDTYNVRLWIDDRPQLLRLIASLGIKTLACGDPYIEF